METQSSYTASCCGENHIFIHTGELCEGCPCVCGKTVAHFETCPTCGQIVLKPIDSEKVAIGE